MSYNKFSLYNFNLLSIINNDFGKPYQLTFQDEATPIMIGIRDLHDNIMYILIIILIFVTSLIIINLLQKGISNRTSFFNHSTLIEIIWTIIPALILVIIAIPTFKFLYVMDNIIKPLITLKVQGSQWYWTYSILDNIGINIEFTSYTKSIDDLKLGELRLLEVDNRVLLPIHTPIRILVTANDVIHAWAIPSLGIKIDAIPGRINHTNLFLLREGVFYGSCSELCAGFHYNMSIVIEGVSKNNYINWLLSFTDISINKFINLNKFFNKLLS